MLARDREADRAAADADVEHTRRLEALDRRERSLDEDLRLGSWNERAEVRLQRQPPETPLPQHIGERLPLSAPLEQGVELPRHLPLPLEQGLRARHAEHVRDQKL